MVTTPVMTVLETMVQGIRALMILTPTARTQVNQGWSNLRKHSPPYNSNSKTIAHKSSSRELLHNSSNSREAPRNSNNQELLRSNNGNLKPVSRCYSSRPANNDKPPNSSTNSHNSHNNSLLKFSNLFHSSPSNNHSFSPNLLGKQALRVQLNRSRAITMY